MSDSIQLPVRVEAGELMLVDADGLRICDSHSSSFLYFDDIPNLERIAHCLNSHPELMKALELAEKAIQLNQIGYLQGNGTLADKMQRQIKENYAALEAITHAKSL